MAARKQNSWMVVRVRPTLTRRALVNMARQDYECYSPCISVRNKRTGHSLRQPMFPGYIFARHRAGRWASLNGTIGVLSVIMGAGEQPGLVPHAEIERLRAREDDRGIIRLGSRRLSPGENVHVERGPLGSFDAVVDGMSGEERVFVFMELLGRWTRVEVDAGAVSRE